MNCAEKLLEPTIFFNLFKSKNNNKWPKIPNTDKISERDRLGYVLLHYEAMITNP